GGLDADAVGSRIVVIGMDGEGNAGLGKGLGGAGGLGHGGPSMRNRSVRMGAGEEPACQCGRGASERRRACSRGNSGRRRDMRPSDHRMREAHPHRSGERPMRKIIVSATIALVAVISFAAPSQAGYYSYGYEP